MDATTVLVPGGQLEVFAWGSGEPVVFIQTALTTGELRPVAEDPALDGNRRILYHRRGYAGSSSSKGPHSIPQDAADRAALLHELSVGSAHVVGLSYAGAVGLQLAADRPDLVRTLILIEPPPVQTPSAPEFRAANERLIRIRRKKGPAAALDEFLSMLIGPDWRHVTEQRLPDSSMQMQRDASTFFDNDIPALLEWDFGPSQSSSITCPVLYIGGSASGPWFDEVRELMHSWFPDAGDVVIEGADHSLAVTHPRQIARAIACSVSDPWGLRSRS